MKKKYVFLLIALILFLGLAIGLGSSYAYWQVTKVQTETNTLTSNCFSVEFLDNNSKITLTDAIPVTDEVGMTYDKYTFTIKNTCSVNAMVDVNQELLTANTLSNTLIKSVLDDNDPVLLTTATDKTIESATSAYKVGSFFLKANTTETHTIGLWVDASATPDNANNKVVNTQISVVANATTFVPAYKKITSLLGTTQGDGSLVYENGYRYEGKDPNNYVTFNNELWRIIGVFDSETHGIENTNLIKIMRDESIGDLPWASSNVNDWSTASLQILLNGDYYNKTGSYATNGLDEASRNMIQNVTWHLGSSPTFAQTASTFYANERGTAVLGNRPTTLKSKIGLMYPSDYGYSAPASTCARTINLNYYTSAGCYDNSWIYNTNYQWTISSLSSSYNLVSNLYDNGYILYTSSFSWSKTRPVLYLKDDTQITSGNGSKENPYIINL